MSSAVKFLVVFCVFLSNVSARELNVLVLGQSISANCNEFKNPGFPGVFQYSLDGFTLKPASDPLELADCKLGSIWIFLGELLIKNKIAEKVNFFVASVQATKIADWQLDGHAFSKVSPLLKSAADHKIEFDYGLWFQGSSDYHTSAGEYYSSFLNLTKNIRVLIPVKRWLIARHSYCFGRMNPDVESAQSDLGHRFYNRFFPGPSTNGLERLDRFDDCHLSHSGQLLMAKRWYESFRLVETYEREMLLGL